MAGIVSALHQALRELAVDGWASLDAAARWMSENHAEQTPQTYGCARWRHLIHESGQFELRRMTHNGQFGAWLRERPTSVGEVFALPSRPGRPRFRPTGTRGRRRG